MPGRQFNPTIRVVTRMADIAAAEWDACAGPADPFLSHAFLEALEASGSACARSGWAPRHLVVEDRAGRVLACAPLYLKSHSYGEYVFDWAWADAWERAGGTYYPKLQCCVPFTPVTGRRLLVRPEAAGSGLEQLLIQAMLTVAERLEVSSLHVTFPDQAQAEMLGQAGLLPRVGQQYHWRNNGYGRFDDFLAELSSRKRKAIRKERERANSHGLDIRTLTNDQIAPRHWDAFHEFYLNTVGRKWANAYLTRDFFHRLGRALPARVVLVVAERAGAPVAAALNLLGADALYGRLWGAAEEFRDLHFELCYYRAIDFAIAHGLPRVEAGAQGEHKIQRGYLPTPTWSAHWIADPRFRSLIARVLEQERQAVADDIADLSAAGPFRHADKEQLP